jgi:hypothetical protein
MKKLILVAGIAAILAGCYNDKADKLYPLPASTTCDTTTISYKTDVQPIINSYCAISGCHNSSGDAVTGNLDFTIFATLQANATPALMIDDITGNPGRGHNTMPLSLPS